MTTFFVNTSCKPSQEELQIGQLHSFANEPSLISDKLFVLGEYQIGMRERALAEIVYERATDTEVKEMAKIVREDIS